MQADSCPSFPLNSPLNLHCELLVLALTGVEIRPTATATERVKINNGDLRTKKL
jgi:hypothetical protein